MFEYMLRYFIAGPQRSSEHKTYLTLLQNIRSAITHACFRTGICQALKTKCCFIKMGSLLCIAYVKFYVVSTIDRQEVLRLCHLLTYCKCFHILFSCKW